MAHIHSPMAGQEQEGSAAQTALPETTEGAGDRLDLAHAADLAQREAERRRLQRQFRWVRAWGPRRQPALLVFSVLVLVATVVWPLFRPPLVIHATFDEDGPQRAWRLASCFVLLGSSLVNVFALRWEERLRERAVELGFDLESPASDRAGGDLRPAAASD